MSKRHADLFERLEPPSGGLARLRARLDEAELHGRAPQRRLAWAGGLAAVATLVLAAWLAAVPRPVDPALAAFEERIAAGEHPALILAGLAAAPREAVSVPAGARGFVAVQRVPVDAPNVDFYLVASTRAVAGTLENPPDQADGER